MLRSKTCAEPLLLAALLLYCACAVISATTHSRGQHHRPEDARVVPNETVDESKRHCALHNRAAPPARLTATTRPLRTLPRFDDVFPRNVTAAVGGAALLRCRVNSIGNRTVSWIRKRDLHILTSHIFTYTGDGRFSVLHPEPSDDWDLRIEYVQPRDAGVYECQVNTEPKVNLAFHLNVEDAAATIWGSQDVYVKKGSTISLTCSVNVHSTPPSSASVLWYHGSSVVDFDSPRGGISLETEKTETGTTSKLLVTKAALVDSGNYTCVPSNAHAASVSVHVLNGEHPAAIQTSSICIRHDKRSLTTLATLLYIAQSLLLVVDDR